MYKYKEWAIWKLLLEKNFNKIIVYFFSYLLPIIMIILMYYLQMKVQINQANSGSPTYIKQMTIYDSTIWISGIILVPALGFALIPICFIFGASRTERINKIYSTYNISPEKYFIYNFLILLIQQLVISNVLLLVYNFLLVKDLLHQNDYLLSANEYFAIIFSNIYGFGLTYILGILICLAGDKFSGIVSIMFLYYLFTLFSSGTIIPSWIYTIGGPNANDTWYKWLAYITPIGSAQRFSIMAINDHWIPISNHLLETMRNDHNNPGFNQTYIFIPNDWATDWLAFVSPLLQASIATFLIYKFLGWRYHRDINTLKGEINQEALLQTAQPQAQPNYEIVRLEHQIHELEKQAKINQEQLERLQHLKREKELNDHE